MGGVGRALECHYLWVLGKTLGGDLVYCYWIVVVPIVVVVVVALPQLLYWRQTPAQLASVVTAVSLSLYSRLNSNSRYYLY